MINQCKLEYNGLQERYREMESRCEEMKGSAALSKHSRQSRQSE